MFVNELFESDTVMNTLVVYPGRFQPWHKGHKAVYDYLVKNYGRDNVFIATSNKVDPPRSPFTFSEKVQFMNLTGVASDRIIETRDPYRSIELVQNYDPATTRLIFAVSEKDMSDDPRFSFKTKKDGSPSYLQPMPKNVGDMVPFQQHGYIMTVPTFNFSVLGQPMRSATEVRAQFAQADEETQRQIVTDLFGSYDNNVHDIMRIGLTMTEDTNTLSVGTTLNLVKNYGNFNALTGVVRSITPSGKLKIQITKAEPVPGKKGAVKIGDIVTMAQNYVKRNALSEATDPKFVGFMNKALGDKADPAKPAANMPAEYSNFEIMSFDNMPGYRPAFKFGMSVLQAMDQTTRQHFINAPDDDLIVYMMDIAKKKRFVPKYFVEEDLDEVTQWFDEIFADPSLESWTDLLKSMSGKPGIAEGDVIPFKRPSQALTWQQVPRDILMLANDWFWASEDNSGLAATIDPEGFGNGTANDVKYLTAKLQQKGWTIDFNDEYDAPLGPFNLRLTNKRGQTVLLSIEDAQSFTGWAKGTSQYDLEEGDVINFPKTADVGQQRSVNVTRGNITPIPKRTSNLNVTLRKDEKGRTIAVGKTLSDVYEAFDRPEKLIWEKGDYGDVDAYTQLDDGTYLSIMFNHGYDDDKQEIWNVEFWRDKSQLITGAGDAQRVFATVLGAIQTFIKEYQPNRLIFAVDKKADVGQNINSRTKLYDSLVLRYAKSWGFRTFRADTNNVVIYQFSKIKPKVAEVDGKVVPVAPPLNIQSTKTQLKQNVYVPPEKKTTPAAIIHIDKKEIKEFASVQGGGDDDPYQYPKPEHYARSIDFFGQFEAEHFDKEEMNDATGEFKGYWYYGNELKQIAYFKFDNPKRTGSNHPGMGWYYEPQNESVSKTSSDLKEFAPIKPPAITGGPKGPKDYGQPNSSRYLGGYKFVLGTTNNYILTAEVQKYGLEWDDDDNIWFLDSPGAVYIADATEGEIALPPAREQRYQIHDLVSDYLNARNSAELQKVAAYFGFSADGEMNEAINEFAPPGSNDSDPDEYEILRKLAAQWWHGTEQEMIGAQKTLATMGWEIGQDESGDEDAGVFVVAAGDIHGDTYTAFGHTELEQVYRGLHEDAAGVGVVASKKQKNDPRYKTSLTVDVHPDTPKKNMRALRLI